MKEVHRNNYYIIIQSNPVNMVTEGTTESVSIEGVSVLNGSAY